jgi:hypothetical protein
MSSLIVQAREPIEFLTDLDMGSMFFYGKEKVYGSIP